MALRDRIRRLVEGGDINVKNLEEIFDEFQEKLRVIEQEKLALDTDGNLNIPDATIIAAAESIILGTMKISAASISQDKGVLQFNAEPEIAEPPGALQSPTAPKHSTEAQWVPVPSPPTHAPSHEDGGDDEIDLTGLSGVPADVLSADDSKRYSLLVG